MRHRRFNAKKNTDFAVLHPYEVRKDIDEGDSVHCLAFPYPLMNFSSEDESDEGDEKWNE